MMPELAERPEDVPAVFAERFNSGDAAAVAEVYEAGAVFVPEPGTALSGAQADTANRQFMELGLPITVRLRHVYRAGDIALLIVDWTIAECGDAATGVHIEGTATDIARRGLDGRWRYVVDNPFGTAPGTPS